MKRKVSLALVCDCVAKSVAYLELGRCGIMPRLPRKLGLEWNRMTGNRALVSLLVFLRYGKLS